jgi:hypothetical protein
MRDEPGHEAYPDRPTACAGPAAHLPARRFSEEHTKPGAVEFALYAELLVRDISVETLRNISSLLFELENSPMPNSSRNALLLTALAVATAAFTAPAAASLGGDESTVAADHAVLEGQMKSARVQRYAVHEIAAPSGTVVREFVSPAGKVFGVAWSGPTMPDLRQVLGPYFDTYVAAVAQRKAKGPVNVVLPGLVVQSSGHMRSFSGKAYLPDAVPAGVASEEIK